MKAQILTAPHKNEYGDLDRPTISDGETLVRVTHSGICGTDLKIFQGGIPVKYPMVMGHESVGEVVEGGNDTDLKPGQRVIVDPALYCGKCYQCRDGQTSICLNGGLIGRDVNGGFAEYVTAPTGNVYPLSDDVDGIDAPLIQPMTTCYHSQRLGNIRPGEGVVVLGLGVTGLLHVQIAKAHGAYPVIGITRTKWKRELAAELGADFTIEPDEHTADKVRELFDYKDGPDVVIESVGHVSQLALAIDMVRAGGRILPFGIYTAKEAELPLYQLYFKEIEIVNARAANPEDYPSSIDLVARGVVQLKPLITHTIPLAEMHTALEMLDTNDPSCIKIILDQT